MLLGEALGHIHRLTGLDVAAFLPENKALAAPLQGAFTLGQIMEQLATSVEGDWSVEDAGVELVWVRDVPEAVSYLGRFRRWWGELRPATREALLARQIVLLNAQEKKALAAFAGQVSLDPSWDDGDDWVGLSLNYDLDLLVYRQEIAKDRRSVLHLYERVLPPAGIGARDEKAAADVWRPVAEGEKSHPDSTAQSAPVTERRHSSLHFAWGHLRDHLVVLPAGPLYPLGQLASVLSAASGSELVVDRLDKEYLIYLSQRRQSVAELVRWLVDRVGFDVEKVGSVYHLALHPCVPSWDGDFSSADVIHALARTLGKIVLSREVERLGIPFAAEDVRNARIFRCRNLTEEQKGWLQAQLAVLPHVDAGTLGHYRGDLQRDGPLIFVRLLPRFFLRVARYQPHGPDVLVVRQFTDIPLDRLPLFPPTVPDTPYFHRLLWRQDFVAATLPRWEARLANAIAQPENWLAVAEGLADIGRRKYAPYAERLVRLGDAPVRAAAERALQRMSLLPGATRDQILEQIQGALAQPWTGGPQERVDWARMLGECCASLGCNRPLDDLGPIYQQAVARLQEQAQKDADERARWAATLALYAARRTPPRFDDEVEELRNWMRYPRPEVGQWFLEALRTRIECQRWYFSPEEVELLREAVQSKQPHLMPLAVRALGHTGLQTLLPFLEQCIQNEDLRVPAIAAAIDLLNLSAQQQVAGDTWTLEAFSVHQRSIDLGADLHMGLLLPELYLLGLCATPESKAARVLQAMGLGLQDLSEATREAILDPEFQRPFDEIRRRREPEHGKEWWVTKPILTPGPTWAPFMERLNQLAGQHPDGRIDSVNVLEALLTTDSPVVIKVLQGQGVTPERVQAVVAQLGLQRGSGLSYGEGSS